ncbi:hypothetical protein [Cyclobacterium marinum]|uniref:Uncharacterized protein n=1 Tax=Cyclobacterium marinum (strain ATCC 25205 / DSM 745 / LMG 13164 / NCIMB 1802) TaxID=880070 RepID=G0J3A0_CYCMS|nr:hypothetical protein [Cyclobacterium marinum]AEL24041.1 hypothetical protein Cycma_0259 [Cyclobacterium marinum DSM 745]
MYKFTREQIKQDPDVLGKLHQRILKIHEVANHTKKVLLENKEVNDFCEKARHFATLRGGSTLYVHYDITSWLDSTSSVKVKVDYIVVYDNFMEFETAKNKGLHSGRPADIPNIN